MSLVGCEVIDNATKLRGRITAVASDGSVGITWKGRIGVSYVVPTKDRFSVIIPS